MNPETLVFVIILAFAAILTAVLLRRGKRGGKTSGGGTSGGTTPSVKVHAESGAVKKPTVSTKENVELVYEGRNLRAARKCCDCGCVYPEEVAVCEICGSNLIPI